VGRQHLPDYCGDGLVDVSDVRYDKMIAADSP
jgi:hypothetical protein